MIYQLNNDVLYVSGATQGAIYSFIDGKVYWVKGSLNEEMLDFLITKNISPRLQKMVEMNLISLDKVQEMELSDFQYTPQNVMVWLELTQACNLRCVHCYDGCVHKSLENKLSLDDWKNVIKKLKERNFKRVILIGGEPLACPFFLEILDYCYEVSIEIEVFSNLTLINEKIFKHLVNTKCEVHFSLYGDKEAHEKITQIPGSFEKTLYWVKRLKEAGLKLVSSVVLMKENFSEKQRIEEILKELKVDSYSIDGIRPMENGTQTEHMPSKEENRMFEIHEANFKADKKLFYANLFGNSCLYGKFAINENGDVYPCEFIRDSYGNVLKDDFDSILKNLKDNVWSLSHDKIDECKDCEFRYVCRDCRHLRLKSKKKSYRCFYCPSKGMFE